MSNEAIHCPGGFTAWAFRWWGSCRFCSPWSFGGTFSQSAKQHPPPLQYDVFGYSLACRHGRETTDQKKEATEAPRLVLPLWKWRSTGWNWRLSRLQRLARKGNARSSKTRSLSDQAAAAGEQGREMEKLDVMRKWTKWVVENKRTKIKHHWIVTVESGKGTWLLSPRSPDNGWLSWKSFGKLPIVKVATNGPARWSRGRARNLFSHTNPLL